MKPIRKAVRCFVIKEDKVVVIRYKDSNKKAGYYDIPGGKIEEGETPKETASREMKEETTMQIEDWIWRGKLTIEYPDRIFLLDVFYSEYAKGEPQEVNENEAIWMSLEELIQKKNALTSIIILNPVFIKDFFDCGYYMTMHIVVDEQENVLEINYKKEMEAYE